MKKKKESILLIEPGGFGDVLIVAPIAHYYFQKGFDVTLLVQQKILPLAPYFQYAKFANVTAHDEFDKVIDLELGSEAKKIETNAWRDENKRHFDEWKYDKAEVPFEEKFKLTHGLNVNAALTLMMLHGLSYRDYIVVCATDSAGRNEKLIELIRTRHENEKCFEIYSMPEFSILDWVMVIMNAGHGYFVDSSFSNLANGSGALRGRRSFLPNHGKWGEHTEICTPVLSDDWEVIPPL